VERRFYQNSQLHVNTIFGVVTADFADYAGDLGSEHSTALRQPAGNGQLGATNPFGPQEEPVLRADLW